MGIKGFLCGYCWEQEEFDGNLMRTKRILMGY